jgi:hypothetical protein
MATNAKRNSSMTDQKRKANRDKARSYRARMRALGLKPIQIWVPDVNAPGFEEEARRQARLIAISPHEAENQAFIDAISIFWDEE